MSFTCAQEFKDGEILVEWEPKRYELRDIKRDRFRQTIVRDPKILGTAQLSNPSDTDATVAEVITYNYSKTEYWGTAEGVARGLPTKIYENGSEVEITDGWGLEHITDITKVCCIRYFAHTFQEL